MESKHENILDGLAVSIVAICRLDNCSVDDVIKKFNISDKLAAVIKPMVESISDDLNAMFDIVDKMSDEEFDNFAAALKGEE